MPEEPSFPNDPIMASRGIAAPSSKFEGETRTPKMVILCAYQSSAEK